MFLVQALPLVGGINLKSSISNPQAASLVGAVNLKSTIGNLQLFDFLLLPCSVMVNKLTTNRITKN